MVGHLRTVDFDDPNETGVYQYSLQHNRKTIIFCDSNSTIITERELDFENNSIHTLLLRVTDHLGAYLDQNLTISVVDAFVPIVETGDPIDVDFRIILSGKLLDKGSSLNPIEIGVQHHKSESELEYKQIIKERGFLDAHDSFEVTMMGLKRTEIFYQTYAINAEELDMEW